MVWQLYILQTRKISVAAYCKYIPVHVHVATVRVSLPEIAYRISRCVYTLVTTYHVQMTSCYCLPTSQATQPETEIYWTTWPNPAADWLAVTGFLWGGGGGGGFRLHLF